MEARNYNYAYEDIYIENTAIPVPKERQRVRVRKKVKSNSKTRYLAQKFILATIVGVNLLVVALSFQSYVTMSKTSLEISNLSKEINELETTRDFYKVEIAKYSSTERIEDIAKNKLGMYYPENNQYLYISTENPKDIVK